MKEQKVAVIGCGMWGRNIVRNFYNLNVLDIVCDLDPANRQKVLDEYKNVKVTSDYKEILNDPEITGVAVVTPSHTHYKMVKEFLLKGKNVYVEKPISTVAQEARELTNLANEKGLVLMVGHLLLYHPAVNRLKMLIDEGELGDDVSVISYITSKDPVRVISAVGCSGEQNEIMDITHVTLEFEGGVIGHISDSWITPRKHVTLLVRGTKATATLAENKLQVFDNFANNSVDIKLDYLEIEPLKLECQHFVSCCENGTKARSDGENGFLVTKILEEAEKIMLG